jgi:hypothetical protein
LSPLSAASATWALNAGEWLRRFRLLMLLLLSGPPTRPGVGQGYHLANRPNFRCHLCPENKVLGNLGMM